MRFKLCLGALLLSLGAVPVDASRIISINSNNLVPNGQGYLVNQGILVLGAPIVDGALYMRRNNFGPNPYGGTDLIYRSPADGDPVWKNYQLKLISLELDGEFGKSVRIRYTNLDFLIFTLDNNFGFQEIIFPDYPFDGGIDLGTDSDIFIGKTTILSSVPEPATWAMMILGLIMIGGILRYTRINYFQPMNS